MTDHVDMSDRGPAEFAVRDGFLRDGPDTPSFPAGKGKPGKPASGKPSYKAGKGYRTGRGWRLFGGRDSPDGGGRRGA